VSPRVGGRITAKKAARAGGAAAGSGTGSGTAAAAPPPVDESLTIRSQRSWYGIVVLSALFAIPAAIAVILFVLVVNHGTELVWETLPAQLGIAPEIWIVAIPTLAGLLVGLIIRFAPGGVGPRPAAGHGLGGDDHAGGRVLPGVIAVSVVSLVGGASLGPEAPLVTIIGAMGAVVAGRLGLPAQAKAALSIAGISSMIAGIFGSPMASVLLLTEAVAQSGRALYRRIFPAIIAACIGYFVFDLVIDRDAEGAYPAFAGWAVGDVVATVVIAAVAAVLGLLFVRAYRVVDVALRPLDRNVVVKALLGGLALGIVGLLAGEEVLFSGEHTIAPVANEAAALGLGGLLVILAGKVVATLISLATGFRGGRIFPVMFLGGALGAIATVLAPEVPLVLAVGAGMVGAGVAIFRLPLFVVVFAAFFTSVDVIALLVVAAVVAYVIVDGQPELGDEPA